MKSFLITIGWKHSSGRWNRGEVIFDLCLGLLVAVIVNTAIYSG